MAKRLLVFGAVLLLLCGWSTSSRILEIEQEQDQLKQQQQQQQKQQARTLSEVQLYDVKVAPSGPSPGGNAAILGGNKAAALGSIKVAPSGPSPGGNAAILGGNKAAASEEGDRVVHASAVIVGAKLPKSSSPAPSGPSKGHNGVTKSLVLNDRKPKGSPTTPSGPNPGHNSIERLLDTSKKIGCIETADAQRHQAQFGHRLFSFGSSA